MNVLTINPGSTAVKYVLFDSEGEVLEQREFSRKQVAGVLPEENAWLGGLTGVGRVGIRIVHGGPLRGPIVLDVSEISQIRRATPYAPIHNGLALEVLTLLRKTFPQAPVIASFDTDFHRSMPDYARTYPISARLAKEKGIERYGFHGLALQSILQQLNTTAGGTPRKVIVAHLGGGCSVTAIKDGKSIDTTMGLTPLEGIMMITRSGSVDPYIVQEVGLDVLNNESGFYGLTGSKNTLDIIQRGVRKEEPERLALDIFVHQIVKQVYAYYGVLQGCDTLVISGGIGAGNAQLRARILKHLALIGITEATTSVMKADEARVLFDNALRV